MIPRAFARAVLKRRSAREHKRFLAAHPLCEIAWDAECTWTATEVHDEHGRRKAACHGCHQQATFRPAEAFRRGVSVHRHGADVA